MEASMAEKVKTEKINQIKESVWVSYRLLKLVWGVDKRLFLGTLISTAIPAIIPFINIYIYKLVIDLVVKSITSSQPPDYSYLYSLIALRMITYFTQEAVFRTQAFVERLFWTKVPITLNELVYKKTSSLDIQYFEDSHFKDLLEKVRDAAAWRPQELVMHLFMGLQSFIQVIIATVAIAKLNPFLMILVISVSVPEFIIQTRYSKLSYGIWSSNSPYRKRFWYLAGLLQHYYTIKEVKIFKLAKNFMAEIRNIQEKYYKENAKLAKENYFLNLVFNVLSTLVFVGVEVFVILEALARRISVGDISFYTGVVMNFQSGLGGLFRNMNGIFDNSLYVKSIFEVLDAENVIQEIENPIKTNYRKTPKIEFKDVDFSYPNTGKRILKNFNLTILPGEKIALVGENGAGKTTLIKLLSRFYDVSSGEILIDGENIKNLDLESWYKCLGVLFQDFNKYEHTVTENISFGKAYEEVDIKEVVNAATSAGAHEIIEKLDKGYEQMLGKTFEGGLELSGGQWQKIALSRAFLRNAPVLVLDEPTAAIDAKAESEIFNRVEKLAKDKTVIIISHRFSTVRNADKIYVIDKGQIIEEGNHKQLMRLNGQYAILFKLQAKGYQ